jgi:hypothetical protein
MKLEVIQGGARQPLPAPRRRSGRNAGGCMEVHPFDDRIVPVPLAACIHIIGGDPAPMCARRRLSGRANGPGEAA